MESYHPFTHFYSPEDIMMRFPIAWALLNIGIAAGATYLLVATQALGDAAYLMFH
jgi:hypothetical protein